MSDPLAGRAGTTMPGSTHPAGRRSWRCSRTAVALAAAPLALALVPAASSPAGASAAPNYTVYTETNSPAGNEIVALQSHGGVLQQVASYAAGGTGTGTGLGSQGAVVTSVGFLLAVNAGSNQLSAFHISDRGALHRTDVVDTGGVQPVSVAVHHRLVYVVNAGDASVTGYRLQRNGHLTPLGVHVSLPGTGPAQISFDRTGSRLLVTEKATSTIDVLPVTDGIAGPAVSTPSAGQTPFGFAVDAQNHVIVSNAAGGASGASTLSSYALSGATGVDPISAGVPDTQSAACWVLVSGDGRYVYTSNTGSGSISSYRLGFDGTLSLLAPIATSPGAGPIDMALAGHTMFSLAGAAHRLTTSEIRPHGGLTNSGSAAVADGVAGLAVAATRY